MPKLLIFLGLANIVILLSPTAVFALTSSVNVSTKAEGGGNTSANVNQQIQSSSTNTTSKSSRTDIRIESNGEVKEYHSEGDDDVTIESSDGNSSVTIRNETGSVQGTSTKKSPSPTTPPTPTTLIPTTTPLDIDALIEAEENKTYSIIELTQEIIEDQLESSEKPLFIILGTIMFGPKLTFPLMAIDILTSLPLNSNT